MFFLPIKIRTRLSKLFLTLGLNSTPMKGSGTFLSILYHEGVSSCLPYIKKMKLNADHGSFYVIYSVLIVFKAKKLNPSSILNLDAALDEKHLEEIKLSPNLWDLNNDYEMDILQDALLYKYDGSFPWE